MDRKSLNYMLKKFFIGSTYDISRIIYLYRYLSWCITSVFYIAGMPKSPLIYKIIVVLSLLVAGKITTDIYIKNKHTDSMLKYFVMAETIGITLLLFTTGGISSPFIWYALNPVLVAANFLSVYFCWANLVFYVTSALLMSYWLFNEQNITLFQMFYSNSNAILVLILITIVVGMLSNFSRQLNNKTEELYMVNKMLEEYLQDMMGLYQVVEAFSNQSSLENFLTAFTEHAAKLVKTNLAFFWAPPSEENESIMAANNSDEITNEMLQAIETAWETPNAFHKPEKINLGGKVYLVQLVKSSSRLLGFLGIAIDNNKCSLEINEKYYQKFTFLSELSAVILERFQFEDMANNLMVVEEQTRIANEVHDSVSQRIFSITCALHSIKARWKSLDTSEIEGELDIILVASRNALKELRSAIYGLSYKKRGEKVFEENIRSFLRDMQKLNNIAVSFSIEGDAEGISAELKSVLHRVIHEASGNAIRHGCCSNLCIYLVVDKHFISLTIADDGMGFDTDKGNNVTYGLGIYNMRRMIESFNGKFTLKSKYGEGTEISIKIPSISYFKEEGGVVFENRNSG